MTHLLRPSGHRFAAETGVDRIPPFDPRSADHLWVILTMYRVDPAGFMDPARTPMLDNENLISVTGIGCYYCEREYSPLLATRRCKPVTE